MVGTAAMFLVGGGIVVHGLPLLHDVPAYLSAWVSGAFAGFWATLSSVLFEMLVGVVAGALALCCWTVAQAIGASRSK